MNKAHIQRSTLAGLAVLLVLASASLASATTYYVSPSGNDAASGTSTATPWRTVAKVNGVSFAAGDAILFQGGATFSGSLSFNSSDAGTDANRITVGSYGSGKAAIASGSGRGVHLQNTGGFILKDLVIQGSGIGANTSNGVEIYNSSGTRTGIRIENCEIHGYGSNPGGSTLSNGYGIMVWTGGSAGIDKIEVLDTEIHHCENTGLFTWASTIHKITNVTVRGCVFRDNPGRGGLSNHSGNGMLLGSVETALVEYCSAYNNGALNTSSAGPVGIWTYDSNNVTIQFCEAYANKTAGGDGGGFDLDGGATNCVIQYCYSHDNYGAGYLVACYSGANPLTNNVIRYNISENDGRRGGYGAITLWGAGANDKVENTLIYGNTIYCGTETPVVSGTPSAVRFLGAQFTGVKFWNNLFVTNGTTPFLINADSAVATTVAQFQGNDYWAMGNFRLKWGGTTHTSFSAWATAASTQERTGANLVGLNVNPLLDAPGQGGTIGDPTLLAANLTAYQLTSASPLIDAGLDLAAQFGVDPGGEDFYGTPIPAGSGLDVGAHESSSGGGGAEIILDNTDSSGVTLTGSWPVSTGASGYYGSNYLHDGNAGKGSKSVRFTPSLSASGSYEVYARWAAYSNRASNTPIDVVHTGGTDTVIVNQQQNGGLWYLLGTYNFAAGTSGHVVIRTTATDGYVVADAVRFVAVAPAEIILDNADATGITLTGSWWASTGAPGYYGSDYLYDGNSGKGSKSVRFTPVIPVAGTYEVYALWTAHSNRASNTPIDVVHAGGTSTVVVNQQQNGGVWYLLGTYNFAAGTTGHVLIRTTATNGYVVADAVRFVGP